MLSSLGQGEITSGIIPPGREDVHGEHRPSRLALRRQTSSASCSDGQPAETSCFRLGPTCTGPTVSDVALEAQSDGVVVLATATDPEGTDNMLHVLQTIGVFPDAVCQGAPIVVQDDLACSGCEESFGAAVPTTNQTLYNEIAAAQTWPVTLDFSDIDGHRTQGRVLARVLH